MEIEEDKEFNVKEIWSGKKWYTSVRKNNQRAVFILWEDDSVTLEPVCNTIDFVNKEINEKMIPILKNWEKGAKIFNSRNRKCAFCNNNTYKDYHLCISCSENTKWINKYTEENSETEEDSETEENENQCITKLKRKADEFDEYSSIFSDELRKMQKIFEKMDV